MKKYINFKILFSFLAIGFIACDDNLDIEPEQNLSPEVATESPANIKTILNNIYGEARQSVSYGGGIGMASELLGNEGDLQWNGTFVQPGEYNEKALLADNSFVRDIWLNAYEIGNQVNIVLDNLDVFDDEEDRATTEGEAKFLRGLAYFDLVRLFAKPYVPGQANTQLAVPIILEPVLDASIITYPARNTVDEVYAQVLSDLNDAYEMLPTSNGYFADKYTAKALLARVHLQRGEFAQARDAANEVIEDSGASLTATFADAFNNAENSTEDLFAMQVTSQDASGNSWNLYWAGRDFGGRVGNPDISILSPHYAKYDDPNDDRANFFYTTSRGVATTKWQNQFGNIPVIRLAEMYLIRAETNQRLGTTVGATPLEDINLLRARANATLFTAVTLEIILAERQRELAFEGFALFDAKRLGRNIGEIAFNADRLVLPVPLREMDSNPNLVQNPGY
ncbi:RagB/SusD family nutrient uptake outer membrane protein [Antarcticibacterium arcticum]|uniref:RagB/SusD family nutrient uptake outer membrane protein n=1 Tax=Antarcticibacterium arcticum TaxID=2585771 RepID=A0A5B8YQI3_9FLAO|nr:RagB/SusD family nutrient uptake outer membrane protein [Antarcticibacterium arcticum]QED38209.1 RagB/SusD family nutrient uptake outer membrane protein [Antarcticibacterium arcticum]